MDIGTAKPSPSELIHYGYKLIDILKPGENISAYDFLQRTLALLYNNDTPSRSHQSKGRTFIVGGTMFYQEVLRCGLPKSIDIPAEVKTKLQTLYDTEGIHALQEILVKHDPLYYAEVDIHNHRRLLRALEVILTTGKTFSALRAERTPPPLEILSIGVTRPRASLYEAINQRVEHMFEKGWAQEVEKLLKHYSAEDITKAKTIGYEDIITWLECTNPKNSTQEKNHTMEVIRQKTRQMAKRQLVWMKKNPPDYLLVQNYKNHDKNSTSKVIGIEFPFRDPEDAWMNDYEKLKSNGVCPHRENSLRPKCNLILIENSSKVNHMLNTLEHILGVFYE